MQSKNVDSREPLRRLERRIARLKRRAQQLERPSGKYWVARRVLLLCGSLLALLFCKLSGVTTGLVMVALFLMVVVLVAIYHSRLRDGFDRNGLMLKIKLVQVARINLDWERLPRSYQAAPEPDHPFDTDLHLTR